MNGARRIFTLFLLRILLPVIISKDIIDRPVIGVLSQPTKCNSDLLSSDEHYSYINSDYVKWLQMNGANVVPVIYDWDEDTMKNVFSMINGLLLPGGGCPLTYDSAFLESQNNILQWATKDGEFFPIWGTCQGFESLFILVAGTDEVLDRKYDARGMNLELDFNDKYQSRIFADVPSNIMEMFKTLNLTFNSHDWGISPSKFNDTASLHNFFNIISTNRDLEGREFISTVEAKDYPIYGSQWHSEIVVFSDLPSSVHSYEAVMANQVTSIFFVEQCRQSSHSFPDVKTENQYAIENYMPVFTAKDGIDIRTTYFFEKQRGYNPPMNDKNKNGSMDDKTKYYIVLYTLIGVSSVFVCIISFCCLVLCVCVCLQILRCAIGGNSGKGKGERQQLFDGAQSNERFFSEEMGAVEGMEVMETPSNRSGVQGMNQDRLMNSLFD